MQAYNKAQKQKAIKKAKTEKQKIRTEKLTKRNPARLQQRIDELKDSPRPHDKKIVADLERELAAVKKARAAAGIVDREYTPRRADDGGRADTKGEESDSGESTASSVREIPLPPGPLPPLPGERPPPPVKTTYESAPVLRDLRKEVTAFVPTAVKRKLEAQRREEGAEDGGRQENERRVEVNAAPEVDEEMRRFEVEVEEVQDEGI